MGARDSSGPLSAEVSLSSVDLRPGSQTSLRDEGTGSGGVRCGEEEDLETQRKAWPSACLFDVLFSGVRTPLSV